MCFVNSAAFAFLSISGGVAPMSVNMERLTNTGQLSWWLSDGQRAKKIYISMTADEYFILVKDLHVSC